MASIAYICDQEMIEFHRLNGSHSINFWRTGNLKKINYLNIGDLVFFLMKGSEQIHTREKGLVGYGKFKRYCTLSFNHMWNKYGEKNGYPTKELLEQAICKVTKDHQLPNQISCFELEDVVFFQYPVYLSEIGMKISNHIESFTYIDKEELYNTNKILEIAKSFGEDLWATLMQEKTTHDLMFDAKLQTIQNISSKINSSYYTKYDETNIQRFISEIEQKNSTIKRIGSSKTEYMEIGSNKIIVCFPCLLNSQDINQKLQYLLGHYFLYQNYIMFSGFEQEIECMIVFNKEIEEEWKNHLQQLHIKYKTLF